MWRIYYADGSVYTDRDGPVEDAPAWGVVAIVEYNQVDGKRMIVNADYYVWEDRGMGPHWWEANQLGLIDYLQRNGWKKVVFGRLIENDQYNEIRSQAYKEMEAYKH